MGRPKQTHCKNGHELTEENIFHSGTHRGCRICKNAGMRKYLAEHPEYRERRKKTLKAWHEKHPNYQKEYGKKYVAEGRARNKVYEEFGSSIEEYEIKKLAQNNRCAICGKSAEENGGVLAYDHNHETMTPRDLLCVSCNAAIGHFQDNPDLLEKAIRYLRKHEKTLTVGA